MSLPYRNSDFEMFLILPNSDFENHNCLSHEDDGIFCLNDIDFNNLPMDKIDVNLRLPKFKATFESDLKTSLKKLDVKRIFNDKGAYIMNSIRYTIFRLPILFFFSSQNVIFLDRLKNQVFINFS